MSKDLGAASIKNCCGLARCLITANLKECGACGMIAYCCKEHQEEHFKEGGHKMICSGRKKGNSIDFKGCFDKATTYYERKMWVAAFPYYSAMLEFTERAVGILHPQIAKVLEVLATLYKKMGKHEQAINCMQRYLITIDVGHDGSRERNLTIFNGMGRLAEYYMEAGRLEMGKELLTKAVEMTKESFGEDSFERGRALCALGGCIEREGNMALAEETLLSATDISNYRNAIEPSEIVAASHGFFNLGVVRLSLSKPTEALADFNRSLDMRSAHLASDHPDILACQDFIGKANVALTLQGSSSSSSQGSSATAASDA